MAGKQTLTRLYDFVPDWLWPHLKGDKKCPPEYQYHDGVAEPLLDQVERQLDLKETEQGERIRTVEAKLTPLLTLSLILSTGVIASLTAVATLAQIEKLPKPLSLIAILFIFYVALQLCRVLWSAIDGLTRRAYKTLSINEFLPVVTGEGLGEYRNRILNIRIYILDYNNWVIDQKVGDMAVAHRAYKNMLGGTLFLIVFTLIMVVVKIFPTATCWIGFIA